MNYTDHKLDAILRCLLFYYVKSNQAKEIYQYTGEEPNINNQFISDNIISAWLDFSENEIVNIDRPELIDLLKHLESTNLIISQNAEAEKEFKILPEGISLVEKSGYGKKYKRSEQEYKMKTLAIIISIVAFLISLATFIYTVFIKK